MKASRLILISVLCNLGLLTGVAYVTHRPPATAQNGEVDSVEPASRVVVKRTHAKGPTVLELPPPKFTWHFVEAEDYKKYIANLRAIDCPEETIRDIILADVEKLYAQKMKTLRVRTHTKRNYWEGVEYWDAGGDGEFWQQQRALEKEKRALLIELLGVDPQKERNKLYGFPDREEQMYGFLSQEKRDQAKEIQEHFQDLQQKVYRKYKGYWGDEVQQELKQVEEQRKAELAKILTPTELEEYNLRSSQVANNMQWELRAFEPSEEEYRKLFKIKDAFNDTFGNSSPDPDDKEAQAKYQQARNAMDQEIKSQLGDARYNEYKRGQDYNYQQLTRLASRAGLPKETASKIYDMKDAAEQAASKIRANTELDAQEKNDALKAIRDETEKTVSQTLGDKAYGKYKDRYGWWMRSLYSQPRQPN